MIKPKLLKLEIRPEQLPDLQIELPEEPATDTNKNAPLLPGSPGPNGPINASGQSLTISVTHYVRPIVPAASLRAQEHGTVAVALLVDERGSVRQVKVLRSSGSRLLDGAALRALRQWKFTPVMNGTRSEPVWTLEKIQFTLDPARLGVDLSVTPYDSTVDQQIRAAIKDSHDDLGTPVAERSLRRLIVKLFAAYTRASPEETLVMHGRVQSVEFLGFAARGLASDGPGPEASSVRRHPGVAPTHWEVYDIQQQFGSSIWLVALTADGSIQRVQVAIRPSP